MMYPFMTLKDNTELVHYEVLSDNQSVKVYIEKPVDGGFHSAECYLPAYQWKNIEDFITNQIEYYQSFLESVAHIILRLAKEGGVGNTNNFV